MTLKFKLKKGVLLHSFLNLSGVIFFNIDTGSTVALNITLMREVNDSQCQTFMAEFSIKDCPELAVFIDVLSAA